MNYMNHNTNFPGFFKAMDQWMGQDLLALESKKVARKVYAATNILEKENGFELEIIAPGRKKEDFKIEINNSNLEISFNKLSETQSEKSDAKFILKEFDLGSFRRIFKLDDNIDLDQLKASYQDGILRIELPKKTSAQPTKRLIEIA